MNNKNQPTLLDDLIRFLETEKKMYGPFSVQAGIESKQTLSTPSESKENHPEKAEATHQKDDASQKSQEDAGERSLQQKLEACSTLDELRKLCDRSEQLRTDLEETNLVFGTGNPTADLIIVGEAPGFNEDQQGEPFVGAAGKLLNKILEAVDFKREDVYIANILKHRPPDNRNPSAEERQRSLPFLEKQIDLISPKIILCVGKVSGTTLLDKDDALKRMRGKFYPYRGTELTVTYHPAALLRNPKWKRPVWEDVQQVRKKYDELGGKP